jgi:hypothetical protein
MRRKMKTIRRTDAPTLRPTETVTPLAMTPVERLEGGHLLDRVSHIGEESLADIAEDSRYLAMFCDKLERDAIWQKLAPTWDEFCQKVLGHPAWFVDMHRAAVAMLDEGPEVELGTPEETAETILHLMGPDYVRALVDAHRAERMR